MLVPSAAGGKGWQHCQSDKLFGLTAGRTAGRKSLEWGHGVCTGAVRSFGELLSCIVGSISEVPCGARLRELVAEQHRRCGSD